MYLTYDNITMDILTVDCQRSAVYADDGVQYLATKWDFSCEALYNPYQGLSFKRNPNLLNPKLPNKDPMGRDLNPEGKPGGAGGGIIVDEPIDQRGASPIQTDGILRNILLQPRKVLKIWDKSKVGVPAGNSVEYLVDTSINGNKVDPKWGPFPKHLDVRSVIGSSSFVIQYQIEWYEHPTIYSGGDPDTLLLGNVFSMLHELDQNYGVVRSVEGYAVFRADALERLKVNPDSYRPNLFLPIPVGWKRENIRVQLESDNQTVRYHFVDRQLDTSIQDEIGIGVTSVSGELNETLIVEKDLLDSAISGYREWLDYKAAKRFAGYEDPNFNLNNNQFPALPVGHNHAPPPPRQGPRPVTVTIQPQTALPQRTPPALPPAP